MKTEERIPSELALRVQSVCVCVCVSVCVCVCECVNPRDKVCVTTEV